MKAKNYFYVIVPLEYQNAGAPSVCWFVHDLMAAMQLPYYVGLLAAARLYGASPQQPQEFQVFTDRSVRAITVSRVRLRFFASKYVADAATVKLETSTGSIQVSSPETTVVDLARFSKAAGYLNHVAGVTVELAPSLRPEKLLTAVRLVNDVPNAQRLGDILDLIRARRLADSIRPWVRRQDPRPVPLRSGHPVSGAKENRRWHVLVNEPLEFKA